MITFLAGLPVLVEVFWKSGVALGAALCINALLRRKSADVRRLVLSTVIVVMFVAAVALPALPRWVAVTPIAPAAIVRDPEPVMPGGAPDVALPANVPAPKQQSSIDSWALPGVIPLIWFAGTALLLARFAIGLRGLRRLRNASEPVTDAELLESLGTGSTVALLQSEDVAAPVTWGVVRPVILVPAGFEQLPAECRSAVLCHELAHIQGYDFLLRVLAEIARALIWFQPLIWIAWRQLREEQELACDNRVLAAGGKPSAYAKLLLDWDVRPGKDSLIAVGIAHRCCLKRRLYALLDQDLRRDRVAATGVVATWFLALATALPLAAITFTHPVPAVAPIAPAPLAQLPAPPATRLQMAQARPAPAPLQAPAPAPQSASLARFSTSVMLVIVPATVKDKNGTNMEDLKAGDFVVIDDGVPQTLSVFELQKLNGTTPGISSYYILGFYSTNLKMDGSYRKINVALKDDTPAKLEYRAGYYTNKSFIIDGVTCPTCDTASTTFPVLASSIQPEYSEDARKAKYSGTVTLNIQVDASGRVVDLKVVRSLGMGLDEKAVQAVQQWTFKPGIKDGKPVAMQAQVEVHFALM